MDEDDDEEVRRFAASSLFGIDDRWPQAILRLITALNDHNPNIRDSAAVALGDRGRDAISSIPTLIDSLKKSRDEDFNFRLGLVRALALIGSPAPEAIPEIIDLMSEPALEDQDIENLSKTLIILKGATHGHQI